MEDEPKEQPKEVQASQTMSPTVGKLAAALAKAQGEIVNAKRESKNPFFNAMYADLASVWDACRGPLSKNELCVIQTTEKGDPKQVVVCTRLVHSSGEWVLSTLCVRPIPREKKNKQGQILGPAEIGPQEITAAITYARRSGLAAIAGVAAEDDDGEKLQNRTPDEVPPWDQDGRVTKQEHPTPHIEAAKAEGRIRSAYDGWVLKPGESPAPLSTPPATKEAEKPKILDHLTPLVDQMASDGVTMAEMDEYLVRTKKPFQKIDDITQEFAALMLKPVNWAKVKGNIEKNRKAV